MGLENATYISDLDPANPLGSDPRTSSDDHHRLTKKTLKNTFPNIAGAVTPTHTELNYVDGVTSPIQDQINGKASTNSPAFQGTPTTPTPPASATGTEIVNAAWVNTKALNTALPGQSGNAGKVITTDGSTASWKGIAEVSPASYQEFINAGTTDWTKPANITFVYMEAIGAGGGGANHTSASPAGGGGGGAFNSALWRAADLPASLKVNVGNGGLGGGTGGNNAGTDGQTSSVTDASQLTIYLAAPGGKGGRVGVTGKGGGDGGGGERGGTTDGYGGYSSGGGGYDGGAGGQAIRGGGGGGGVSASLVKGAGGGSVNGGNGNAGQSAAGVRAANGEAGGGGGAASNQDGGGGNGGTGRIKIWCW